MPKTLCAAGVNSIEENQMVSETERLNTFKILKYVFCAAADTFPVCKLSLM